MSMPSWLDAASLVTRDEDLDKGDTGHVAVAGGSRRYRNTPGICGYAALRTGADLVTLVAPEDAIDSSAVLTPGVTALSLPGGIIGGDHVEVIIDICFEVDVLVAGNGLGRDEGSRKALLEVLDKTEASVVIDGDLLGPWLEEVSMGDRQVIVTPHEGEFERLYEEPAEELGARKEQVKKAARVYGATVVLKGRRDIVSDGDRLHVNDTGNSHMARGGTGDVLAGVAGALLARAGPFEAGCVAAHVAGRSGDKVVEDKTEFLLPELMDCIPAVLDELR